MSSSHSSRQHGSPVPNASVLKKLYQPKYWRRTTKKELTTVPDVFSVDSNRKILSTETPKSRKMLPKKAASAFRFPEGSDKPDSIDEPSVSDLDESDPSGTWSMPATPETASSHNHKVPNSLGYVKRHSKYSTAPPKGYLWIWLGHFKRWLRKFFVLSTPGILVYSNRPNGGVGNWSISLRNATVGVEKGNSRQFYIVTNSGIIYLRALSRSLRTSWINSIQSSIDEYKKLVEQTMGVRNTTISLMGNLTGVSYDNIASIIPVEPEQLKLREQINARLQLQLLTISPQRDEFEQSLSALTTSLNDISILVGRAPVIPDKYTHTASVKQITLDKPQASLMDMVTELDGFDLDFEDNLGPPTANLLDLQKQSSCPESPLLRFDDSPGHIKETKQLPKTIYESPFKDNYFDIPHIANKQSQSHNQQQPCPRSSNIWLAYKNYNSVVEAAFAEEIKTILELQAENSALRVRLREEQQLHQESQASFKKQQVQQIEVQARDINPVGSIYTEAEEFLSRSMSQAFSTGDSEEEPCLLEESEGSEADSMDCIVINEEDKRREEEKLTEGKAEKELSDVVIDEQQSYENKNTLDLMDSDLLRALEVVRRVEYVSRNSTDRDVLHTLELPSNHAPPIGFDDDDSDSDFIGNENSEELSTTSTQRTRLPAPKPLQRGISIWSILKNAIGRDLTRITMPATINEPLSALQRLAEEFEYHAILKKAAFALDPQERLLHIAIFALSSYSGVFLRDNKPFNPLLGETYEYTEEGFRFIGEQVSHHPPISCLHAEGFGSDDEQDDPLYQVHGEFELRSKFWGKSVNVTPTGRFELDLRTTEERFVWNKGSIAINNIVFGALSLDLVGEVVIKNETNGDYAKIKFIKSKGSSHDDKGEIDGKIYNSKDQLIYVLTGKVTDVINAEPYYSSHFSKGLKSAFSENAEEVFRPVDLPRDSEEQYNMSKFAIILNEFRHESKHSLPRTDSRFRPDIRSLENGEVGVASAEKQRLEEKQRQARRARKENGQKYIPRWFHRRRNDDKDSVKLASDKCLSAWEFNNDYWQHKANGDWAGCPDIY